MLCFPRIRVLLFCLLPVFLPLATSTATAGESEGSFADGHKLLQTHCSACHNDSKHEGDLDLSDFQDQASMLKNRKRWLEILRVIEEEEMPPEDPLPSADQRQAMVQWIDAMINQIDWSKHRHPGRVTTGRLTRVEYSNTMRDLFGVDLHAGRLLSQDGQGETGFENDRDALFVTSSLMEKYLSAASRVLDGVVAMEGSPNVVRLESEAMFMTETGERPVNMTDDFFGYVLRRGQMTLYESVIFPVDGHYEFSIRAQSTGGDTGTRMRLNDRFEADIAVQSGDPKVYRVIVFVPAGTHQMTWNIEKPITEERLSKKKPKKKDRKNYTSLPDDAKTIVTERSIKNAPTYPRTGDELARIKPLIRSIDAASRSVQRPIEWLRLLGPNGDPRDILRFKSYVVERTVNLNKAKRQLGKALGSELKAIERKFDQANQAAVKDNQRVLDAVAKIALKKLGKLATPGNVGIDWIEVRGPVLPPVSKRTPVSKRFRFDAADDAAAKQAILSFASRAFRRPVKPQQIPSILAMYDRSRSRGDSIDHATKLTLMGVLVSPPFLFRLETTSKNTPIAPLDDHSLASRMSYFLWLSMPDDELTRLASEGQLRDPDVRRQQVLRMLADPKSAALFQQFTGHWLGIGDLGDSVVPDAVRFPQFDEDLAAAMRSETVLTFQSMVLEGGSLLQLLDSEKTFLNKRLAAHYEITGIEHTEMRSVSLDDPLRGGLLGMASVLTTTSSPTRTSPMVRGKWVLETLLGRPAGDPPADAGALPGDAGEKMGLTLREELIQHRRNPTCAACHDKLDPLGFGLESFDAIGRFRQTENGKPIDSSGTMPSGVSFDGPAQLKQYLLDHHKNEFTRNLVERMLSFALGRKLYYFDSFIVDQITDKVIANNYSARTLIQEIVASYPMNYQAENLEPKLTFPPKTTSQPSLN